jgi:hypothetical protein
MAVIFDSGSEKETDPKVGVPTEIVATMAKILIMSGYKSVATGKISKEKEEEFLMVAEAVVTELESGNDDAYLEQQMLKLSELSSEFRSIVSGD